MKIFCANPTIVLKKTFLNFFDHKKLKKPPSKVAQKTSNPLFSLTGLTAQTEEFMFQNVAY